MQAALILSSRGRGDRGAGRAMYGPEVCGRTPAGPGTGPVRYRTGRVTPLPATPANSADGGAEPPRQLVEQILLIVTDPRHVAVRP